jgi:CubicO group peptidase (beta-lactamase class C family)
MERWLQPALDNISTWIEFQMRASQQPGCVFAVAHRDQVVLERAIGYADIVSKEKLTARHRLRVASHPKFRRGRMKLASTARLTIQSVSM